MTPPLTLLERNDTYRLIATKPGESVLKRVTTEADLPNIVELDNLTNDRLQAENNMLHGIGIHELLFGVPYARIVNAAFTHAHPLGGRFNGPDRGAWYAAYEIATAQAEVAYHKTLALKEINRLHDSVIFDSYLADFSGEFHDLRAAKKFSNYLNPSSYMESQKLAQELLARDSLGIVYPSVRRKRGTCIACFRPALVTNVRRRESYRFIWSGSQNPSITRSQGDDLG
ncbi:MAG TPA: RES family NAD+ phosphorylase [Candidatus Rubrimentiphilum sp.]|nr:RES family NAD+ phosphorylase [Candidatus Rubrimentiphilum sp.]